MSQDQLNVFMPQLLEFLYVEFKEKYMNTSNSLMTLMHVHRKSFRI